MTTNRTAHQDCDHEATKAARAACRKAKASAAKAQEGKLADIIAAFATRGDDLNWLFIAARTFPQVKTDDRFEAAAAVLDYFGPSGDEAQDARRRANGYIVTTDPYEMVRITLRRHS
jgi:hypothetical protein